MGLPWLSALKVSAGWLLRLSPTGVSGFFFRPRQPWFIWVLRLQGWASLAQWTCYLCGSEVSCDSCTVRQFQIQILETGFTLLLYRRPHSPKRFLLWVRLSYAWTEALSMNLGCSTKALQKWDVHVTFWEPILEFFPLSSLRFNSFVCAYSTTCAHHVLVPFHAPGLEPFHTAKDVVIPLDHSQPFGIYTCTVSPDIVYPSSWSVRSLPCSCWAQTCHVHFTYGVVPPFPWVYSVVSQNVFEFLHNKSPNPLAMAKTYGLQLEKRAQASSVCEYYRSSPQPYRTLCSTGAEIEALFPCVSYMGYGI